MKTRATHRGRARRNGAVILVGTVLACALLMARATSHRLKAAQAEPGLAPASACTVEVRIAGGRFFPTALDVRTGAALVVRNEDPKRYTLEGAGILRGDVPIDAASARRVCLLGEPGVYTINVEEDTRMQLAVRMNGLPPPDEIEPDTVAHALAAGRQPVLFPETRDPAYTAYSQFDLTGEGEEEREKLLDDLFEIARTVESDWLPPDLNQYLTRSAWVRLRPSVAVVIGLGPGCYNLVRFGPKVAASRPPDLHAISYGLALGLDAKKSQRDILIRVTSDCAWFNQQVCRFIWRKLGNRITNRTLDCGYANPNGRSTILGGFFDGTGNPIDAERDKAVFLRDTHKGGTYMAWFRIRFDQERFAALSDAEKQAIIGRIHDSGRQLPDEQPRSHRSKTEGDGSRSILRQGVVFDDGPEETGILFASLQASLTKQLEGILRGFMMNRAAPSPGTGTDQLMKYMHFESGGYYFIPPPPKIED